MRHASLAARYAIGFEQPHLCPAQAKPETDGIIYFFGCGDAVFNQPQRLAPYRLKEPVCHKGFNFLGKGQRMHADAGKIRARTRNGVRLCRLAPDKLDKGQEIDRVEGMPDKQPAGMPHLRLQVGRHDAGCRRAYDGIGLGRSFDFGIDRMLDLQAFWHGLDNQFSGGDRISNAGGKVQAAGCWHRCHGQLGDGVIGIGHDRFNFTRCLRIGVENLHIDTILDQPGDPAAADDPATNNSRKTRLAGRSVYLILHGTCSLARDRRAFGQAKLVAHSLGANDGRTHIFDQIHGAFNKLCVGCEHTA